MNYQSLYKNRKKDPTAFVKASLDILVYGTGASTLKEAFVILHTNKGLQSDVEESFGMPLADIEKICVDNGFVFNA